MFMLKRVISLRMMSVEDADVAAMSVLKKMLMRIIICCYCDAEADGKICANADRKC